MNQPDKQKKKFTYFEFKEVFAVLHKKAQEETEKLGKVVTVPELIRRTTLNEANEYLIQHGQKPLDLDPSAGKYAPGQVGSAVRAVVNMQGKMTVFDKNGKKLPDWKKVTDIPRLLRTYPRCKVLYASHKRSWPKQESDGQ